MKANPPGRASRFIIFRLTPSLGGVLKRGYLGFDKEWTPFRSRARIGTLSVMKALADKLKRDYPDLILEEIRD